MDVKMVGIRDLQKHLSFHLDTLRQGDTLVITKRGKPIARILSMPRTVAEILIEDRDWD